MLSIKEYAEKQGITIQAVYQTLKTKENKERLKDHVFFKDGKKFIDDTGVKILDDARKRHPVVVVKESESEKLKELQEKNDKLKDIVIELQGQLLAKQQSLENAQKALLNTKELERQLIASQNSENALKEQINDLQHALENEKAKTWLEKLFKKG